MKAFILALSLAIFFSACSFKTQTNKLPESKKYHFPTNTQEKSHSVSEASKNEYEQALRAFFGVKNTDEQSIYEIGLKRGHFNEKEF